MATLADSIPERLATLQHNIAAACERSGRSRGEVTLVVVSKTFPVASIDEAIAAGATDIGENKVQEAESKFPRLSRRARFHLIGHLQSNKSRTAAALFDVIQTVDSVKLARRLDEAAAEEGKRLEVLIQVNVGLEEQKHGVAAKDAPALAREVAAFEHLDLTGLMTIPPVAGEIETRGYFAELKQLRDQMRDQLGHASFRHLSMGMSSDYELAIEEGATVVRVGSAIFGSRS